MKKSDLIKLAIVGVASASITSGTVFASDNSSNSGAASNGQSTEQHKCGAGYQSPKDSVPNKKDDGTPNYTTGYSSSQSSSSQVDSSNSTSSNGQKSTQSQKYGSTSSSK
jgi:hypothetical protein